MKKESFVGVRLISYYNIILSMLFIFGSVALIAFSKIRRVGDEEFLLPLLFLILFALFCILSAFKYLRHKNIGRLCLMYCCIGQVLFSIAGLIVSSKASTSLPMINVIMLFVGSWGIRYLNTKEAKEWVNKEQSRLA